MNVLLDLDQTLIFSIPTDKIEESDSDKLKTLKNHNMDNEYIVFERPYLQEFLDFLFKNFKVSIWTAANKEYALFIMDNIIIGKNKDRKIEYLFFKYHTKIVLIY